MAGKISQFLCADHARLDDVLRRATADVTRIDHTAYAEFREGLLRHIGMEEKILEKWPSQIVQPPVEGNRFG